jgi:hypothetical protein
MKERFIQAVDCTRRPITHRHDHCHCHHHYRHEPGDIIRVKKKVSREIGLPQKNETIVIV